MNETLITPEGLGRLSDELDRLKTVARNDISARLREAAAAEANVTANADYLATREEQALLETRIARLEARLRASEVAELDLDNSVVDLGEVVRLRNVDTGKRVVYAIVGSLETDLENGRISAASPLGRAVLGRQCGETVVVETPRGRHRYRILSIAAPAPG